MSDFLNQFKNDSYKKEIETDQCTAPAPMPEASPAEVEAPAAEVREESGQSHSSGQKIFAPQHDTEIDTGYQKRKNTRTFVIIASVIVVLLLSFLLFRLANQVTVKNFVGAPITEAKTWGLTNKVTIDVESVYSIEQDQEMVITQSKEPNSKIQKGSVLLLQVSKGADPDEALELPDFSKMTTADVTSWKETNKAVNANINQEYSETVPAGNFIRMEFNSLAVNKSNYTRKDGLLIYMSKGPEVFEKNIEVPDFAGKPKAEVATWASSNKIEVTYTEEPSDKEPAGTVISQSIPAKTKIAAKTEMTFVLSQGKAVVVPNFNNLTREEAASYPGLVVTVKSSYSGSVKYGKVISQSVAAGKELVGENLTVTVVYSEGKPYLDNLLSMQEKDLQAYFYDFSVKGAKITYSVTYVDSSAPKGSVVWASRYNEFLPMSASIDVHISKGNLEPPAEQPSVEAAP